MACLRNEKTTISRIKLVMTRSKDGAKTKRVKTIRTFRELTRSFGSPGADRDISIFGTVTGSAPKAENVIKNITATALKMATLP